jgi:hypothetical protein
MDGKIRLSIAYWVIIRQIFTIVGWAPDLRIDGVGTTGPGIMLDFRAFGLAFGRRDPSSYPFSLLLRGVLKTPTTR